MARHLPSFLAGCAVTTAVFALAWWFHGDAPSPPSPPTSVADAPPDAAPSDEPAPAQQRTIAVRVRTSDDGRAIAGAHVLVSTGGCEGYSTAEADTDADGLARVALPSEDEDWELTVRAKGFVRDARRIAAATLLAAETATSLDRAGVVRGVVRGTDGRVVAGAHVDTGTENAVTDDRGAFEIDGIRPGEAFTLSASQPDDHRIAERRDVVVPAAGESVTADLTLVPPATLVVRVLWPDGLPIWDAGVAARPADDGARGTDADGQTEFRRLYAGRQDVAVKCWGFADASAHADVATGETHRVDVRLAPGPTISGVVVDESGAPVPLARMSLEVDGAPRVRCRGDGTFRIACPDETPHEFHVECDGYVDAKVAGVAAPSSDVRILLRRKSTIRCRLTLPPGVRTSQHASAWWNSECAKVELKDGLLTIHVPPAAGRASFHVDGCVVVERDVDASAGGIVDWGEMTVQAAVKLTGRVLDEKARPIAAFIFPKVGSSSVPLTSTDEHGGFTFDGLPFGDAELRAEAEGFVTRTVDYAFDAGSPPVLVTLVRGGCVKGIVLDAAGRPAPKAVYVTFCPKDGRTGRDSTAWPSIEDSGRFTVNLTPGRYTATVTLDDAEATTDVDVVDGETRELTLRLATR